MGPTSPAAADFLFGFTGRPFDADTSLQWNLHRWYDARTGRWLTEDPIGFTAGDANLYRYVGNQPTSATDPTGLVSPVVYYLLPEQGLDKAPYGPSEIPPDPSERTVSAP